MSIDDISNVCSENISNNVEDKQSYYGIFDNCTGKNSSSYLHKSIDESTITFAMFLSIAISPFGILGNIIIIIVFNRPAFAKSTPAIFLKGLASFDILYLSSWSLLFSVCLCRVTISKDVYIGISVLALNFWQCSNWTLVLITTERITAVFLPHKAKTIWTKNRCKIAILTVITLLSTINIFLVYHFVRQLRIPETIIFSPNFILTLDQTVDTWSVYVMSSLIPGIPMICGNCLIVWRLWKRKKQLKKLKKGIIVPSKWHMEHDHNEKHLLSAIVLKYSPKLSVIDEIVPDIRTVKDRALNITINVKNAKYISHGRCINIHKQIRHLDQIATDNDHSNSNSNSEDFLNSPRPSHCVINTTSRDVDGFGLRCSVTKMTRSMSLSKPTGDCTSVTNDIYKISEHRTLHALRTGHTKKSNNLGIKPKVQTNKSSTNVILISICIVFMATNIPPTLHSFYMRFVVWSTRPPTVEETSTNFVFACFGILNSSLNFICYSISGSRFRTELNAIWAACWFCRDKSQKRL